MVVKVYEGPWSVTDDAGDIPWSSSVGTHGPCIQPWYLKSTPASFYRLLLFLAIAEDQVRCVGGRMTTSVR